MSTKYELRAPGPFTPQDIAPGGYQELSNGHKIDCAPSGSRHGDGNSNGTLVLKTDPAVQELGVDVGHQLNANTLRAPDVSVGGVPNQPGWAPGAPPLAVEYADVGTNNSELAIKIQEFLTAGTQYVWVVRLTGPRRVEVHTPGQPMQTFVPGQQLTAAGVLQNDVPVEAMFDSGAAEQVALRNLLNRQGYQNLDEVRSEGHAEGQLDALTHQFERKLKRALSDQERSTLRARLGTHGPARLGDVVLDMTGDELGAWLADPNAT
jgi:Uma2 family endonuclease